MYRIYLTVYIILMLAFGYWASNSFRQEQAKIEYTNPKYIKDVVVFTGRKSRHAPYLTNMTGTILMPYGNNVTCTVSLTLKSGGDFRVKAKMCDSVKSKWMNDFMSNFTNLTLNNCPFPPARYGYINMELPPKNIPIPIADGDYFMSFGLSVTATKEPIMLIKVVLHFDQNARKAKKAKKGLVKNNWIIS